MLWNEKFSRDIRYYTDQVQVQCFLLILTMLSLKLGLKNERQHVAIWQEVVQKGAWPSSHWLSFEILFSVLRLYEHWGITEQLLIFLWLLYSILLPCFSQLWRCGTLSVLLMSKPFIWGLSSLVSLLIKKIIIWKHWGFFF